MLPFHRFRRAGGTGVDSLLGARDEVDGRGHGHRRRLQPCVRQSRRPPPATAPARPRRGVRVGGQQRQARCCLVKRLADLGGRIFATQGTADMLRRNGIRLHQGAQTLRPEVAAGERPSWTRSATARSPWSSTRRSAIPGLASTDDPHGRGQRATIPCITTVQGPAQPSRASRRCSRATWESSRCSAPARGAGERSGGVRAVTEEPVDSPTATAPRSQRWATLRRHRPHPELLEQWGCRCRRRASRSSVTSASGTRPRRRRRQTQVAFFEAFGSPGIAALERVIAGCGDAGALVVADAKRGDIGSTMAAYAHAWLGEHSPCAPTR